MIVNQYEIERYIAASAKRADLRINWTEPPAYEVSTNGKVMNLPKITHATTKQQAEDLIGFVAHECSHVLYSDFKFLTSKGMDPEHSLLGALANIVEDDGIDALNSAEFAGDRMIRNESHARLADNIVKRLQDIKKKNGEVGPNLDAIAAVMAWDTENKGDYYSNAPLFTDPILDTLSPKGREYFNKLRKGNYYDRLKKIRTDETRGRTAKAYAIARDIYEQVFEQNADEEEKRCKERAEKEAREGKGKKGKGPGEEIEGWTKAGKGEGEKEGKGEGEGSKGEMGPVSKGKIRKEFAEFNYKPFMEDQHEEFYTSDFVPKGSHINYSEWKESGTDNYAPTPFKDTIVVDYVKGTTNYGRIDPNNAEDRGGRSSHYSTYRNDHSGEGFANKVRMLLQIRSKGKTQYGVKRGALHPANTYRVIIKDAPGYNERVFKKRIETDILDTAVLVLGDISGSMSGDKHGHQIVAFRRLNDSIGNALHIPLGLYGFTEHDCRNVITVWRHFDTQQLSSDRLFQRMVHSSHYMNQNADGDAVLYAYHVLKNRKEKRKVLIVTSDGSPASSKRGDVFAYTKNLVKTLEKDKRIDIIGIGIMDSNVSRIYKHHRIIKSADEIESALLSIIERKII